MPPTCLPVHLGSMDRSVETVIALNQGNIRPGDVFALNAPYNGGTHLPDITVVTPVFDDAGREILFYVASRGHHADVGGTAPGSMTPLATTVDEEGVLIDNFLIVDKGRFREAELIDLLTDHPYPVRNVHQNVADLKAQMAANEKGVADLRKMVADFGLDVVEAYMGHVQDNAAESVRQVIDALSDSSYEYETDSGQVIRVKISVDRQNRTATVDFTGTSEVMANNFNAPEPVTRAAVLYCFRVMVEGAIPMNAGCLRPIRIVLPDNCMLRPSYPAAVVAGNVETSQHVTNAIFGALGAIANSQGTMNNLTFGDDEYQYYETICSGSPAGRMNDGRGFHGTSGVHVHMTNSRLTDPEILEMRFPVLLEDFHIRHGSGGTGAFNAGDGTERTIRFLKKMECAILSSHRTRAPEGIAGGSPGQPGKTEIRRLDGRIDTLKGSDQTVLEAGEAVRVTTPTAGGFGSRAEGPRTITGLSFFCHRAVTARRYPQPNTRKRKRVVMSDTVTGPAPSIAGSTQLQRAIYRNRALSREGISERLFARFFSGLVYAQIWEDPDVDMEAMELAPGHRIVTIASGGCNVLAYLTRRPARIDAVDLNRTHIALNRLKLAAIEHLPAYGDVVRFFGKPDQKHNSQAYDRFVARRLDCASRAYWQGRNWRGKRRIDLFQGNIYRAGLLGWFMTAAHWIARAHGVDPSGMMQSSCLREQRRFFDEQLAPLFDRPLIRWATSRKASLFGLGIPPAQYDELLSATDDRTMATVLCRRLEKLACHFPLEQNYFARQAFGRSYAGSPGAAVPAYLDPAHYATIRKGIGSVTLPPFKLSIRPITSAFGHTPQSIFEYVAVLV